MKNYPKPGPMKSKGSNKSNGNDRKASAGKPHDMSPKCKESKGQAVWQNMRD